MRSKLSTQGMCAYGARGGVERKEKNASAHAKSLRPGNLEAKVGVLSRQPAC